MELFWILVVGMVITESRSSLYTEVRHEMPQDGIKINAKANMHQQASITRYEERYDPIQRDIISKEDEEPHTNRTDVPQFRMLRSVKRKKHKNRKRHRRNKLKRYEAQCTQTFSKLCKCQFKKLRCDKNGNNITNSIGVIRNNDSYIQVECKTLCDAIACRGEMPSRNKTETATNISVNVTSESSGTALTMYRNNDTLSQGIDPQKLNIVIALINVCVIIIALMVLFQLWIIIRRSRICRKKKSSNSKNKDWHTIGMDYNACEFDYAHSEPIGKVASGRNSQKGGPPMSHYIPVVETRCIGNRHKTSKQLIDQTETFSTKDEAIGEESKLMVENNEENVEESILTVDNEVKVSIVKPLTSPDDEANKEYEFDKFNWDKIFRFLAKILPPNDYRLFFNILYGNCHHLLFEGRDPGSVIEKVELEVRGRCGNSESLMFELFNHWKQLMGRDVRVECIEQALTERSNNLALAKFKEFMRKPPLRPSISDMQISKSLHQVTVHQNSFEYTPQFCPRNTLMYPSYMLPNVPQYHVSPFTQREIGYTVNGPLIEEIRDTDTSSLGSSSNSSPPLLDKNSEMSYGDRNPKRKRPEMAGDISMNGNDIMPNKRRKIDFASRLFNGKGKRNRNKKIKNVKLSEMISLIKRVIPHSISLNANEYDTFLSYTIDGIIKQTTESRVVILSLSYDAYCKREEFKTKRNETFYFIYAETKCLVLRHAQFENLQLYADYARRKLVLQLKEKFGDSYIEPEELFLSNDGTAMRKNTKIVRQFNEITEQTQPPSFDGNLPQRCTFQTNKKENIMQRHDINKKKPGMDSLNEDAVTSFEGIASCPLDKTSTADVDSPSFVQGQESSENPLQRQCPIYKDIIEEPDNKTTLPTNTKTSYMSNPARINKEASETGNELPCITTDVPFVSKHVKQDQALLDAFMACSTYKEKIQKSDPLSSRSFDDNSKPSYTFSCEPSTSINPRRNTNFDFKPNTIIGSKQSSAINSGPCTSISCVSSTSMHSETSTNWNSESSTINSKSSTYINPEQSTAIKSKASTTINSATSATINWEQSINTVDDMDTNQNTFIEHEPKIFCNDIKVMNSLGVTASSVISTTCNVDNVSSFEQVPNGSQKHMSSEYYEKHDSYDTTVRKKIFHLQDPVKRIGKTKTENLHPFEEKGVPFSSKCSYRNGKGSSSLTGVIRPYKETRPLSDTSLEENPTIIMQSKGIVENDTSKQNESNIPSLDKEMSFSTTITANKCSGLGENIVHSPYKGYQLNTNVTVEGNRSSKIDEKVCKQQKIDDTKCSPVSTNKSCKLDYKIMLACLSSLMQNEVCNEHFHRNSFGTFNTFELD